MKSYFFCAVIVSIIFVGNIVYAKTLEVPTDTYPTLQGAINTPKRTDDILLISDVHEPKIKISLPVEINGTNSASLIVDSGVWISEDAEIKGISIKNLSKNAPAVVVFPSERGSRLTQLKPGTFRKKLTKFSGKRKDTPNVVIEECEIFSERGIDIETGICQVKNNKIYTSNSSRLSSTGISLWAMEFEDGKKSNYIVTGNEFYGYYTAIQSSVVIDTEHWKIENKYFNTIIPKDDQVIQWHHYHDPQFNFSFRFPLEIIDSQTSHFDNGRIIHMTEWNKFTLRVYINPNEDFYMTPDHFSMVASEGVVIRNLGGTLATAEGRKIVTVKRPLTNDEVVFDFNHTLEGEKIVNQIIASILVY